ncbi:ComF family protein [Apibacter muscae]|uniref:ComF family protein n=1 Tax=Apibacter muscae TaxID=2509004 RepID=UPI0011AD070A|nr:ComF family protein [Apibacter muscae]TWP30895.1 ComF family protein [Apibacter muscae]
MWQTFLSSLFPLRCFGCGLIIPTHQKYLCEKCLGRMPYTHWRLDSENCMYEKINSLVNIESASALLFFDKDNLTQKLIHFLKYKNYPELGSWMADLWFENHKNQTFLKDIKSVVPVPIHRKRLKLRGYNQVVPCAQRLAHLLNCEYNDSTLERTLHKKSQTTLNKFDRIAKMKNTFTRINNHSSHYLIVDDVFTTGSTIVSCAEELLKNPQSKVSVFTLAIA